MKKIRLLFSLFLVSLLLGTINSTMAQVNAGADVTYDFGTSGQLNATGATYYSWSPTTGLSNPNIANPTVSGGAEGSVTTYTVTGLTASGASLITNGDFESGNSGFTSTYTYVATTGGTALWDQGKYAVGTSASNYHNNFSNCGDHTSGSGKMMILNGAPTPNQVIWSQNITVEPNTYYAFSVYLMSVNRSNPATLQFSIDGSNLGSSFRAGATCSWLQFYVVWNSGSKTNISISVVNQNTIEDGNDFAIDDVSFVKMVTTTDAVDVTCKGLQEPQVVDFSVTTKTWGDADFTITPSAYGASGNPVIFTSSDETIAKCTGTNGATIEIVKPGVCNITANQAGNTDYFAADPVTRQLTINKVSQVIDFTVATKTWGDANFTITPSALGASGNAVIFTSSDEMIAKCTGTNGADIQIVKPGVCNITATQAGNDYYYAAESVTRQLTINKAPQTITFNALAEKTWEDANFGLTATGGASGNPVIFSSSDLNIAKCIGTNGATVELVKPGTCNITASQAGNDYFLAASSVVRSLKINKAPQVIDFDEIPELYLNDEAGNIYYLAATGGNSGNPIVFSLDETTNVVTLSDNKVTILNLGRAWVNANQAGNDYYLAAEQVTNLLDVLLKTYNFVTPNDDGKNDTWVVPQADVFREYLSTYNFLIFNNIGEKLFESKGYKTQWDCTYDGKKVPFGTYYYIITNGTKYFKGFITVKYE